LIAAIYLDGGVEQARAFIVRELGEVVEEIRQHGRSGHDFKSALQEQLRSRDEPLPEYRLAGTTGPDHQKLFRVEVAVRDQVLAEGTGGSKKEAEQEAARLALEKIREGEP
jgi:ribonuclease-3